MANLHMEVNKRFIMESKRLNVYSVEIALSARGSCARVMFGNDQRCHIGSFRLEFRQNQIKHHAIHPLLRDPVGAVDRKTRRHAEFKS